MDMTATNTGPSPWPLMAGWPADDPGTPAEVLALFAEANPRLAALPEDGWTNLSDLQVMTAAFPHWRIVDAVEVRAPGVDVTPCVLLRHDDTPDRWLLITGAGDRLCPPRATRPERSYRLVAYPRYHRGWTGTFDEVMTSLRAATPPAGWHRLPRWVACAVAADARAAGEGEMVRVADEFAAAVWTMHRLTCPPAASHTGTLT